MIAKEQRAPVPPALNNIESLVGLRWHDGADVRPVLLRVLTDLYIQKPSHSPDEERQYVELSLRLLEEVDGNVRAEVARRLAAYGAPPVAVLRRLAEGERPAPGVLAKPMVKPTERRDSRERLLAMPLGDAPSAENSFGILACELNEIFFAADAAERRLIAVNLDYSNAPPVDAMSTVSANEANQTLEAAALQGRFDAFIRGLERVMRVSREHAHRIVNDPSGEPLVVAAKALAMPIDILQRILLCVNPAIGHSVRRVYSLSALYREMTLESALRLLAIWRAASPAVPAADHPPVSRVDDARGPRDFAAAPRRIASRSAGDVPRPRHQVTR